MTGNRATATERDRQNRALALRFEGKDYDEIARLCGYRTRSGAWKAVQAVLNRQESRSVAELRGLEDGRLDAVLGRLNGELEAIAVGTDPAAVARLCGAVVRVTEARIRLHNLTGTLATAAPNPDVHRTMDELKRQFMQMQSLALKQQPRASDVDPDDPNDRAAPSVPDLRVVQEPTAPVVGEEPLPAPPPPPPPAPTPPARSRWPRCSSCGVVVHTSSSSPVVCAACTRLTGQLR